MAKKSILDFQSMVNKGEKITYLTAYDYLTAKMQEKAGVDMILVGDSLGMVSLGYDTTFPVTMDDMIRHSQAVRRGAPNTFIIGDMPYMSYQISDESAIENAGRFIKEAGGRTASSSKAAVPASSNGYRPLTKPGSCAWAISDSPRSSWVKSAATKRRGKQPRQR